MKTALWILLVLATYLASLLYARRAHACSLAPRGQSWLVVQTAAPGSVRCWVAPGAAFAVPRTFVGKNPLAFAPTRRQAP